VRLKRLLLLGGLGIIMILPLFVFTCSSIPGMAAENIRLVIDGREIEASPPPIMQNGRTLVPLRLISESLGAAVKWNAQNKTVSISKADRSIELHIDNPFDQLSCRDGGVWIIRRSSPDF